MNNLIKYIFLALTVLANNDSYSQQQIGENIEKAKRMIDSLEIKDDTLKQDSFIYGGEEVSYTKDWDRIGVVFESNNLDYSIFTSNYKLTKVGQSEYVTVFRMTERLSLENRRKIMESIKTEKGVKVIGDILITKSPAPSDNSVANIVPPLITDQIMVRWKRAITDSEKIKKFIDEEGLAEISQQTSLNVTILKVQNPFNYRVMEVCNKLMKSGLVTFAEPDLYFEVIKGPTYNSHFKTATLDYFTRGNQKIAFQKKTNFMGVVFKNEMSKARVQKLIDDWDITVDAVYMNGLFFVLTFPINLSSESVKTIRESIILFEEVELVGDILIQTENNLILATQDLIIKWKPETSETVKQTFIKQYGLTEVRKIPYIAGGFQYRIEPDVAYASTDICLKFLDADIVVFAEPVIISTSEDD
ncbi:MAG: hypothetical protein PHQ74_11780 [Crocinitomicaceae bacterium]|nr:hypothetical protein [Crocinitomicaceae bacterium]